VVFLARDRSDANAVSDDDDAEYYRQEVGAEPEPELFSRTNKGGGGFSGRGAGGKRWQQKKSFKGKGKGGDNDKGNRSEKGKQSFKGKKRPAEGKGGDRCVLIAGTVICRGKPGEGLVGWMVGWLVSFPQVKLHFFVLSSIVGMAMPCRRKRVSSMVTSMTNANGRQCQEQQEVQEQRERRGRQRRGAEEESVGFYTEEDWRPEMISAK
jgi:hypothetical protein